MKILSADDSMLIRRIISSAAAVIGQECVGVSDGLKALEALNADPEGFDLICLDWNMPNMNGYDCLVAIRADPRWSKIPILMVTTEGSGESILLALKAGATGYLSKPFSEQDLQTKLMECLGLGFD